MYPEYLSAIGLDNLHPGMIMMLFGMLIWVLPEFMRRFLSVLAPICAGIAFFLLNEDSRFTYHITNNLKVELIKVDRMTLAFMLVFVIISLIAAIYSLETQDRKESGMSAFYAGSIMGVVLAGDSIAFIVFWEISAFASTYLIFANKKRRSSKSAFRYIMMHGFGGNMLLVGIMMHIAKYGTEFVNISSARDISFWLVLIGVAVNAAIPPFNGWLSDSYPESTISGTLYMGSFTTKAAIYALIRFFAGTEFLIWVGAIMAVYAACMAIMENDIRRLLSYHIVSQLGMMVAALAVGSDIGIDGASAHAVTNIMFKGVLIMCAGAIIYATGKSKITELGGLWKKMPITSICFLIASLAIAGLPFSSGFASKALVTESLTEGGYTIPYLLVTAAGVGTLLSITLKINYFVFFGKTDKDIDVDEIPNSMSIAIALGTIVTLFLGIYPDALYNYTTHATVVNPFTIHHIVEYIAIFIGGTIPFVLYIKKMAPHDEISLDFDYFYRKPLKNFIEGISKAIYKVMQFFDKHILRGMQFMGSHLSNPYLWTENSHSIKIKNMSFENENRLIGDVIEAGALVLCIMMIIIKLI